MDRRLVEILMHRLFGVLGIAIQLGAVVLAGLFSPALVVGQTCGDVDGSGGISAVDALSVLRAGVGLPSSELCTACVCIEPTTTTTIGSSPNCGLVQPGADLRGCDFSGFNLTSANLQGADLRGASLSGAILKVANLRSARFNNADLRNADLTGADFPLTDLRGALLGGANMTDTYFAEATLAGLNLSGTDMGSARSLLLADLSDADLSGLDLSGVDMNRTTLQRARLDGVNLKGGTMGQVLAQAASFLNATLESLVLGSNEVTAENDFRDCDFTGARFGQTTAASSDFTGADFTNADLTDLGLGASVVLNVTWSNTTCPDGTNSDTNGGTCCGHYARSVPASCAPFASPQ